MTTAIPRKVRSDARLEQLTPAQHTQLLTWLDEENLSYSEVVRRLRQEFGLHVGRTAVACYYQRHVQPLHYDDQAEAAAVLARMKAGAFDAATVNHARMLAFSALVRPDPQIDTATKLLNLVRGAERQEIARERQQIARQRVALAERLVAVREHAVGLRARRPRRIAPDVPAPCETEPTSTQHPLPEAPATESHLAPVHPEAASAADSFLPCPTPQPAEPCAEADPITLLFAAAHPTDSIAAPTPTAPEVAAPCAESSQETAPAETSYRDTPLQHSPQNPPLYSPYFALNRAQTAAKTSPILAIAIRSFQPAAPDPESALHEIAPDASCPTGSINQPESVCAT